MSNTRRIYTAGQNSWSPKPQMIEARRQHVYGPIIPMSAPTGRASLSTRIMCVGLGVLAIGTIASAWLA